MGGGYPPSHLCHTLPPSPPLLCSALQADAPLAATPWGGRLWLTGKYWDSLFEIEINTTEAVPKRARRG